jgi:Beta-lactamase
VARGDETLQIDCVGWRDVDADLPVEPDTIFRIASMTKPITRVAALRLIEAGRLRLDDPVARSIPAFATRRSSTESMTASARLAALERPITIRDLLTHTSGLSGVSPHPSLAGVYDDLEVDDEPMSEIARRSPATRWPTSREPPGSMAGLTVCSATSSSASRTDHSTTISPKPSSSRSGCSTRATRFRPTSSIAWRSYTTR